VFDKTLLLVTYDEHGGLYDHVPPPTGVPSPGGEVSAVGRVQRALLYRKTAAFDFTMLGPRVPAVLISPRIRAGTVDSEPRDHASIPATLRALFAPDAEPLTGRDRWSPPFHGLLTLPGPGPAARPIRVPSGLTTAITAPAVAGRARRQRQPRHRPCPTTISRSSLWPARSRSIWPPSVNRRRPSWPPARKPSGGTQVTRAFAAAADRHRESR